MKTDTQLQSDVTDELKWEPKLRATEIEIEVADGVVTIRGCVDSYAKKLAAEIAVKRVKDVKGIAEEIRVCLPHNLNPTDAEIGTAAMTALKWNCNVPERTVTLSVENGWVTIEGEANWQYQRDAATLAVDDLIGVKGVTNLMVIEPAINIPLVRETIKRALLRSADIISDRIIIETKGTKIILRGMARSWCERDEVERAVWCTPGVREVFNELIIAAY